MSTSIVRPQAHAQRCSLGVPGELVRARTDGEYDEGLGAGPVDAIEGNARDGAAGGAAALPRRCADITCIEKINSNGVYVVRGHSLQPETRL